MIDRPQCSCCPLHPLHRAVQSAGSSGGSSWGSNPPIRLKGDPLVLRTRPGTGQKSFRHTSLDQNAPVLRRPARISEPSGGRRRSPARPSFAGCTLHRSGNASVRSPAWSNQIERFHESQFDCAPPLAPNAEVTAYPYHLDKHPLATDSDP